MKKISIPALFLFLAVFVPGHAQEDVPDGEIFAPFVSYLEAEVRNNLVRLSWRDSRDIQGPVYVYRSESPFSGPASLPPAVEVPYGAGTYLDEIERPGTLYYYVAASDEWGRKYTLSIPYTNTIAVSVGPENLPGVVSSGFRPSSPSAVPVSGVEGITARVEEERIVISFSGADRTRNLILYRSAGPIRRAEDLLSAIILRQHVSSPFIDYPLPGIGYYYAVIYEDDLGAALANIRPGSNATSAPASVPSAAQVPSRDMPLPGINLSSFGDADTPLGVSEKRTGAEKKLREAAVFPLDREKGGDGEAYLLRSIVQGYFSMGEWEKAGEEFRRFLQMPWQEDIRARARFYLGQIYYFQGRGREALLEFLGTQERYPAEANSWIQTVLGGMTG